MKEKSSGEIFAMKIMRKTDLLKNPDVSYHLTMQYALLLLYYILFIQIFKGYKFLKKLCLTVSLAFKLYASV